MSYRLETVNLTGGLVGLRAYALRDGVAVNRINMMAGTAEAVEAAAAEARAAFAAKGWEEAA